MLIIAQEPSQATEKLRRLLDSFGIQSRVFYTNFETDVDKDTISLASSFIYSSEEDYQGKPLFFNDLSVPIYVRSNKSNGLDKGKKLLRLMIIIAMVGVPNSAFWMIRGKALWIFTLIVIKKRSCFTIFKMDT